MSLTQVVRNTLVDLILVLCIGIVAGSALMYWAVPLGIVSKGDYQLNDQGDPLYLLDGWRSLGVSLEYIGLAESYDRLARRKIYRLEVSCAEPPVNDSALADWLEERGCQVRGVKRETTVEEKVTPHTINVFFDNEPMMARPDLDLAPLGYRAGRISKWYDFSVRATVPHDLCALPVQAVVVAMALVGLIRCAWNWRFVPDRPKLWAGPFWRALILGLCGGVLLAGFFWTHEQLAVRWFPASHATGPIWQGMDYHAGRIWLAILFIGLVPRQALILG